MFRLKTFGGALIEASDGTSTGSVSQRRRLALLTLLAASGGGMSRDRIMAMLWPESDEERARHALAQLIYGLRRELGDGVITGGAAALRLDPAVLPSDVHDFLQASERGDDARAADLYVGPFLDGFHLSGCAEFERWVETKRDGFDQLARSALERLAIRAERAGDVAGCIRNWRRLAALDPYDGRVALSLIEALASAGDRTGALRQAKTYEQLLRSHLDLGPEPAISELVATLLEAQPNVPSRADEGIRHPAVGGGVLVEAGDSAAASDVAPSVAAAEPPGSRGAAAGEDEPVRRSRHRWAVPGLITVAVVLLAAGLLGGLIRPRTRTSPGTVAVLPFAVRGADQSLAYLGEGMVALLSERLDGAGSLRAVDANAVFGLVSNERAGTPDVSRAMRISERAGAGLFVLGDVMEVNGRLRLSASLYAVRSRARPLAHATAEGDTVDVLLLVDRLAAGLLAGRNAAPAQRIAQLAASSTPSFAALKAYLEGERELRAGRAEAAVDALLKAVAADTTFALGYYRLSIAAEWASRGDLVQRAAREALRHAGPLAWQERLLIEAYDAFLRGDAEKSEALYRTILGNHPDNVEAWYRLGEVLFHLGPRQGRPIAEARVAFERVLDLAGEDAASLVHLARIAAFDGQHAQLDHTARRALALPLSPGGRLELDALRAFARRDDGEQQRVLARLRDASDHDLIGAAWVVDVYSNNLEDAPRLARLLTERTRAPNVRVLGHVLLAHLELARGRWRAARDELRSAETLSLAAGLEYRALFLALPFVPADREEILATRAALERWDAAVDATAVPHLSLGAHDGIHPLIRLVLLGLLDLRLGEHERAEMHAVELGRLGAREETGSVATEFAMGLRALQLRDRDDVGTMFALLDTIEVNLRQELILDSPFFSHALERYLRAETHAALGQHEEAARWFASFAALSTYDLPFVAPAQLRRAEVYDLNGDSGKAVEHYARFVAMWKDADPELRSAVQTATLRLRQLQPR